MKKLKKRSIIMIATAMMVSVGTVFAGFPSFADSGIKSRGSYVLEDGEMELCAADIDYLQTEMDALSGELSDTSNAISETGESRKNRILSKGIIDYDNGTVVMDSSDLTYLADEIDALESAYKTNTVDALNGIGTYYTSDGSVTHNKEEEAITSENALSLSFRAICEGVEQSQSVAHVESRHATDVSGSPVYYANEEAQNNHNLIEITTQENAFPVLTQPATANNLTAGTAAWVNGSLILGNGADNAAFYQKGYNDGYDEGGKDVIKNIYSNVSASREYDDILTYVNINSGSALWTKKEDNKEETYEIPMIDDQGKILYAVTFTYNYSAFEQYGQESNAACSYELSTKEGNVIESDSKSYNQGATNSLSQKHAVNVNIDLFEKSFSTEDNVLYLHLYAHSQGYYRNFNDNATALARFEFVDIKAKYK